MIQARADGRRSFRWVGDKVVCKTCTRELLPAEFYVHHHRRGTSHLSSYCNDCRKISMICRYRKITREQYDQLMATDTGSCQVCLKPHSGRPSIDHDHATGKIRGLLCTACNSALGLMRDDVNILLRAVAYLTRSGKLAD